MDTQDPKREEIRRDANFVGRLRDSIDCLYDKGVEESNRTFLAALTYIDTARPRIIVGVSTAQFPTGNTKADHTSVSSQDHATGAGLGMAVVNRGTRCLYLSFVSVVPSPIQWSQYDSSIYFSPYYQVR